MFCSSLDILNLSHSLKDICEVQDKTCPCLNETIKLLLQFNLIQANLRYGRLIAEENCKDQAASKEESQL